MASRSTRSRARRSRKTKTARRRMCGTMQVHHWLLEYDPRFRSRQHEIEHFTTARLHETARRSRKKLGPVTIPVVVHVVWNDPAENISKAQVQSQIAALNRDYRAKNADKSKVPAVWSGLVTDPGIRFALAKTDPNGKPTTGITRTQTKRTSFIDDDSVKWKSKGGAGAWPTNRYLNVWVCTLADDLLGYAQFPGGPPKTDGVVILNEAFGTTGTAAAPFNKGRTATHEVGHWLNLRHIWGDTPDCSYGDGVSDTPNAADANTGKPAFPHVTCGNGPNGDMFMNYMDYVDDGSMYMFTAQQVVRMHATLAGPRKSFA